jgi:hypothetical protein
MHIQKHYIVIAMASLCVFNTHSSLAVADTALSNALSLEWYRTKVGVWVAGCALFYHLCQAIPPLREAYQKVGDYKCIVGGLKNFNSSFFLNWNQDKVNTFVAGHSDEQNSRCRAWLDDYLEANENFQAQVKHLHNLQGENVQKLRADQESLLQDMLKCALFNDLAAQKKELYTFGFQVASELLILLTVPVLMYSLQ